MTLYDFPRRILAKIPRAPGAAMIGELAEALDVTYKTAERHVKQLERRGLVQAVATGNARHSAWQATGRGFGAPPPGVTHRTVLAPGAPWPYEVHP